MTLSRNKFAFEEETNTPPAEGLEVPPVETPEGTPAEVPPTEGGDPVATPEGAPVLETPSEGTTPAASTGEPEEPVPGNTVITNEEGDLELAPVELEEYDTGLDEQVDVALDDLGQLDTYANILERSEDGVGPDAIEAIEVAVESICKRFGIEKKAKVSLEAFEAHRNKKESTTMAFEEVKEIVTKALAAVWAAIKKIAAKIAEYTKKFAEYVAGNDAHIKKASDVVNADLKAKNTIRPIVKPNATAKMTPDEVKAELAKKTSVWAKYIGTFVTVDEKENYSVTYKFVPLSGLRDLIGGKQKDTISFSQVLSRVTALEKSYENSLKGLADLSEEAASNMHKLIEKILGTKDEKFDFEKVAFAYAAPAGLDTSKGAELNGGKKLEFREEGSVFIGFKPIIVVNRATPVGEDCQIAIALPEENKQLLDKLADLSLVFTKAGDVSRKNVAEITGLVEKLELAVQAVGKTGDEDYTKAQLQKMAESTSKVLEISRVSNELLSDVMKLIRAVLAYVQESVKYYA